MAKLVLLDENLPQRLRFRLTGHNVVTTAYRGWAGLSNGALIQAAAQAEFDVLLTADQGVNYQYNMKGRRLALIVLSTNRNSLVLSGAERIVTAIDEVMPGGFLFIDIGV